MNRTEVGSTIAPVLSIHGSHVELTCQFSTGGAAVNVVDPTFTIQLVSGGTVDIPAANLLVPFSKDGAGTGRYHACFLGDTWIADGNYLVTMAGKYPTSTGGTIAITGTLTIRAANSIQAYIEMVRSALSDYDGTLYYIEDREKFLWSDGALFDSLVMALNQINMAKPSRYIFSLDGNTGPICPWPGLIIEGAVIYALHKRGILEVANAFNYNDEISLSIDRSGKYQSMLQAFASYWGSTIKSVKQDYAFSRAGFIGIGVTRIPYSLSRIFSFSPMLASSFNWGFGSY